MKGRSHAKSQRFFLPMEERLRFQDLCEFLRIAACDSGFCAVQRFSGDLSIAVLQNTLIMVNAGSDRGSMLTLTAITSGALWAAIMILSVSTLIKREKAK